MRHFFVVIFYDWKCIQRNENVVLVFHIKKVLNLMNEFTTVDMSIKKNIINKPTYKNDI